MYLLTCVLANCGQQLHVTRDSIQQIIKVLHACNAYLCIYFIIHSIIWIKMNITICIQLEVIFNLHLLQVHPMTSTHRWTYTLTWCPPTRRPSSHPWCRAVSPGTTTRSPTVTSHPRWTICRRSITTATTWPAAAVIQWTSAATCPLRHTWSTPASTLRYVTARRRCPTTPAWPTTTTTTAS